MVFFFNFLNSNLNWSHVSNLGVALFNLESFVFPVKIGIALFDLESKRPKYAPQCTLFYQFKSNKYFQISLLFSYLLGGFP